MPDAWDTSVASRVHRSERHAAAARQRTGDGDRRSSLPAPTIQEIVRGLARAGSTATRRAKLRWFGALLARSARRA